LTYGNLRFNPIIESRAHSLDVTGFSIRRGNDTYMFEDLPVSRILMDSAKDDIIRTTFELDEDERSEYLEIDLELPEYDERARIYLRAVENSEVPDMLRFEVEDESGSWHPVEDVLVADLLPPSFLRVMETGIMSQIDSHNLDYLPIAAE
jgi:hypothetical protein